ncbi:MAG TPA: LytTR family DNA-binding domain-containing protein [Verrucomicrobiae bacterium]|jgi:two-component system LytT family response regulator|nr:LytTR family DNA-binding domain-containing protein [Verrucomicrobiae bacterium]
MPEKIRTLIVDDEELARDRLRGLLARETEIDVVGEAADGRSAVALIEKIKPDLVFLDVQMPELDGFEVLRALGEKRPNVVFVTAHDKFALKAFDVHAIDYLLKPFDRERFQTALQRAVEKVRAQRPGLQDGVNEVLEEVRPATKAERLVVKTDGRVLLIKVNDIDWIEAADNYVSLHVGKESHMMRETMNSIESRLPPERFMRVSRSTIVNLERIQELQPMFHGEYTVLLKTGAKVTLSRSYRDKLDRLVGKM